MFDFNKDKLIAPKLPKPNLSKPSMPDMSNMPRPNLTSIPRPRVPSIGNVKVPKFVSIIVSPIAKIFARLGEYLNGNVSLGFLSHPAIRWGIAAFIVLYVGVGLIAGWKTYKVKSESVNIRRILTIYPFPAVLMPTDVILVKDYLEQLRYIRHFAEKTKEPLPPDDQLRTELINRAIDVRLLLRATQKYGVKITKADIDAVYSKIAESNGGPQELEKVLADLYGMNAIEFRRVIRDQLLEEKIRKEILVQVQTKHILIRDEKKAREILEQVKKEPAKFDELAKQHTEDTATRDKSGDLGYYSKGVLEPAFDEAFKGKKGEVLADLVKSDYGFHIFYVADRKGSFDGTYEEFTKSVRDSKKVWVIYK